MNVYAELPVYQVCCVKGNLQVFSTLYFITTTVKVPTEKKHFMYVVILNWMQTACFKNVNRRRTKM